MQGRYREVFIWWGEGLNPSREGVPVFDTDFGRIAILNCFDTNFDEVWQQAERKGAEIVFWPGGYGGGLPLNGYAMIHNYYVVSAGWGNMIDILGKTIDAVEKPRPQQFIATLDLDRTLIHKDFNKEKVARLLQEHPGEIGQEQPLDMEGWYLLRSLKPGIRVRDLCKLYQIETLREYRHRSREQINDARARTKGFERGARGWSTTPSAYESIGYGRRAGAKARNGSHSVNWNISLGSPVQPCHPSPAADEPVSAALSWMPPRRHILRRRSGCVDLADLHPGRKVRTPVCQSPIRV